MKVDMIVNNKQNETIKKLLNEYMTLYHSRRNEILRSYWNEKPSGFAVNLFRPDEARSYKETGTIPVVVNPCETIFSYLYDYSIEDYYTDPEIYLEMYLRQRIDQFKIINDDSCLRAEIPIWLGSYYEHSLFGIESQYSKRETPRPKFEITVKEREDLEKYSDIDFKKTGLIPLAIRFFESISKYVEGTGLKVTMPYYNRGPFGVLAIIVGFERLFIKAYDEPDFIKDAMAFINKVSIDYEKWINKEYDSPLGPKAMYNDDVSCPIISPDFYRSFIFPAEKELEKAYGSFSYWHSCGNCDDLLPILKDLNIQSMNISMVGDIDKYTKTFGNDTSYEICVHPIDEVLNVDQVNMSKKIDHIISVCDKNKINAYSIMASALEGTGKYNVLSNLRHIFTWLDTARAKVNEYIANKEIENI